jgi:hypothetical protein
MQNSGQKSCTTVALKKWIPQLPPLLLPFSFPLSLSLPLSLTLSLPIFLLLPSPPHFPYSSPRFLLLLLSSLSCLFPSVSFPMSNPLCFPSSPLLCISALSLPLGLSSRSLSLCLFPSVSVPLSLICLSSYVISLSIPFCLLPSASSLCLSLYLFSSVSSPLSLSL